MKEQPQHKRETGRTPIPSCRTLKQPRNWNVPGAPDITVYRLMDHQVLDRAVADLERICSQPGMQPAPEGYRAAYVDALAEARAEVERRRT